MVNLDVLLHGFQPSAVSDEFVILCQVEVDNAGPLNSTIVQSFSVFSCTGLRFQPIFPFCGSSNQY